MDAEFAVLWPDEDNKATHVIISVQREGMEPWIGSVVLGAEQHTANEVCGIPNDE